MEKGIRLVGSRITKLEASRNPDFLGKIEMNNNIKILSLEKIKEDKETVKINYEYSIDYNDLGKLTLQGLLFIKSDAKTIKEILKTYNDKNFESPEQMAITNMIIQKASIKAIELEDELGLPIHVRIPLISGKKE